MDHPLPPPVETGVYMSHDDMYYMWIATNTHSDRENLGKDDNDGSSLTYEAVSGPF
jgi:hypothetical protein